MEQREKGSPARRTATLSHQCLDTRVIKVKEGKEEEGKRKSNVNYYFFSLGRYWIGIQYALVSGKSNFITTLEEF